MRIVKHNLGSYFVMFVINHTTLTCIKIVLDLIFLRYIVNCHFATAPIRRVFAAALILICFSLLPATFFSSSSVIATSTATTTTTTAFVQLLSVDQFHRDELLQSLQVLAVHFYVVVTGPFDPQGLHRSGTLLVDGHSVREVDHLVLGAMYHQHRRGHFGYFVDTASEREMSQLSRFLPNRPHLPWESIEEPGPFCRWECYPHTGHQW